MRPRCFDTWYVASPQHEVRENNEVPIAFTMRGRDTGNNYSTKQKDPIKGLDVHRARCLYRGKPIIAHYSLSDVGDY